MVLRTPTCQAKYKWLSRGPKWLANKPDDREGHQNDKPSIGARGVSTLRRDGHEDAPVTPKEHPRTMVKDARGIQDIGAG